MSEFCDGFSGVLLSKEAGELAAIIVGVCGVTATIGIAVSVSFAAWQKFSKMMEDL